MPKIKKYNDVNKYRILEEIQECFLYLTDFFSQNTGEYISDMVTGEYMLYINDSSKNQYANDNYYFVLNLDGYTGIPKGISTSVDFLKETTFYEDLKSVMNRIGHMSEIKHLMFSYKNINDGYHGNGIRIGMIANLDQDYKKEISVDKKLIQAGFTTCDTYAAMEFNTCNLILHRMGGNDIIIFDKFWEKKGETTLYSGVAGWRIYYCRLCRYFSKNNKDKLVEEVVKNLEESYNKMYPKINEPSRFLVWIKNNTTL